MDLMKCDLHQLIVSSVTLSQNHFILFVYQIFRALKAIHSANIIHRDLVRSMHVMYYCSHLGLETV